MIDFTGYDSVFLENSYTNPTPVCVYGENGQKNEGAYQDGNCLK